ncbi:MAG: hypothetical protein IKJ14_06515 [Clostridia bacterium]|nr:hypothetical protein [Clostridia bacterium]
MDKIVFQKEYFNPLDTLSCGQIFRYKQFNNGYLVFSKDKVCYLYENDNSIVIETDDKDYFYNFFDLSTDYSLIYNSAVSYGNKTLTLSAKQGKGIRILKQDPFETLFSFIISQNNNIKRITQTIEKLCEKVGAKISSPFGDYFAFPTAKQMSNLSESDYKEMGFGYRGTYFIKLLSDIKNGFSVDKLKSLDKSELYKSLTKITGVGDKVASCVMLFGFSTTNSFPVDTWIYKIYLEDFNGTLTDRAKICEWFENEFKENSGYFQQYLFHYKRRNTALLQSR